MYGTLVLDKVRNYSNSFLRSQLFTNKIEYAVVAQSVEHLIGNSNLTVSSKFI
jgi:hypothetical protein